MLAPKGVHEIARGRWQSILPLLGVSPQYLTGKHGPCPVCHGKDRFRFDDKDQRGSFICSQCGAGSGLDLLMRINGWDFHTAAQRVEDVAPSAPVRPSRPVRPDAAKRADMARVWRESRPVIATDPVGRYLRSRLGLVTFPDVLRTAVDLPYRHDDGSVTYHPAMLAKVSSASGESVNLHRTFLTEDGAKIDFADPRRMMPGTIPDGATIRLYPLAEEMGVAEGIETAIAAALLFKVPVWAAINAGMLMKWLPPAGVTHITIFGDNDVSYTGHAATYTLARRLVVKQLANVEARIPELQGEDWDDVWKRARGSQTTTVFEEHAIG